MSLPFSTLLASLTGSGNPASITGTLTSGSMLTANLAPIAGTASSWQWTLNGTNISGQTAQTYTVLSTDPGQVIGVKINGGAFAASVSIPAISPVFSAAPAITAATTTGVTFSAATLSNPGTPAATLAYDLYDNGAFAVLGYTSSAAYSGVVGHTMTVQARAVQSGSVVATSVSAGFVVTNVAAQVLRFASPYNIIGNSEDPTVAAGTALNVIVDWPVYVGSGDMSELRFMLYAWNYLGNFVANSNAFTLVSMSLKNAAKTTSAPVTWSAGRSVTLNAGDTDIVSDAVLPSAFSLAKFTRGEKYWMRYVYSVAAAAMKFPGGATSYTNVGQTACFALRNDPATYNGGVSLVDSTSGANLPVSTGAADFSPFTPIVLGKFITGDPATLLGTGNSIVHGTGETATTSAILGWFSRSLFDADGVSNPIGGCNISKAGASGAEWGLAGVNYPTPFFKYAKYLMDEYGTNSFLTGTTNPVNAEGYSTTLWSIKEATSQMVGVIKPLLIPRVLSQTAITAISGDATTVTATMSSTFLANLGTVGTTHLCVVAGMAPSGYNTIAAGVTMTIASATTVTYANVTTAAATTLGTLSDQFADAANQTPLNISWQSGGGAWLFNDWIGTQVGGRLTASIPMNSVRTGVTPATTAYYQWLTTGVGSVPTTDGTHPSTAYHQLMAAEARPVWAALP